MLLKLIRSIKCSAIVIGLFLFASVAVADVSIPFLINGKPFDDTVSWNVTLKAGSAGGLFGDTMGPVRTFRYETVVEVDGKETLVIPGGIYSTDMGSAAASYTVQIPLKDLGILKMDSMCHTYYLKAYTRSYEGDSDVDIGYSLLYVDSTVTVEYVTPKLGRLILKGVDVLKDYTPTTEKENFLVAGNAITAEVEVLDYDENYFDLISAKLIGTPKGGPATKNHESAELYCPLKTTINFETCIELNYNLDEGDGFHGNYEWKVEAEFLCKIDGNTFSEKSSTTNAPVFFKKDGEDQAGIPNWFTYWKEDGACPRLKESFYQDIDVRICVANLGDYGLCKADWSSSGVLFANISIDKVHGSLYHYESGARKVAGKEFRALGNNAKSGLMSDD